MKLKILNRIRRLFMNQFTERLIIYLLRISNRNVFFGKLAPNCYQYKKGTLREFNRNGVKLLLDISDYIQHYIYFGFKDESNEFLISLAKSNDTVIDVGGNIGYTALMLSKVVGSKGVVHSFEPDTLNYERFMVNAKLNSFPNLTINKIGLGEKAATVKLFVNTESNRGGNRINNLAIDNFEEIQIITLDDYANSQALTKVDLIKIDVEGYELKVLKGAITILQKLKPILFVEFDHSNLEAQNDSAIDLVNFLTNLKYTIVDTVSGNEITPLNVNSFLNIHTDIVCKPSYG